MELERLAAASRALNRERRIDRDAIFRLKMRALERMWLRFGGDPAFERYCQEQGKGLQEFATFCALAEHYGRGWQAWPAEYRRPDAQTVGAPPDEYKTRGQDWGLPSFIPHKLRAAAYEPFRQTMRATLRHAGGCASTMSWASSGSTGFRRPPLRAT
jgi:4-alpha-glucanotransferase